MRTTPCANAQIGGLFNELRSEILAARGAIWQNSRDLQARTNEAVRDDAVLTLQHTLLSAEAFDAPAER